MKSVIKLLFSGLLFIIILELLLRISGTFQTSEETTGMNYNYKYNTSHSGWFHTWEPNSIVDYKKNEFNYLNKYNDLGHRDINFSAFKNDNAITKIIFLGDSFTEGDGAPIDSAWTKFFDAKFKDKNNSYLSYNAGVCGSDVFFNYIMLKEKLLTAQPEIVIESINHSDIYDVYYYGDLNRFHKDGTLKSPNQLVWEPLYAKSHVFRMLIHIFTSFSSDLIKQSTWEENQNKVIRQIANQIKLTNQFCIENDIKYYLFLHPTPAEIIYGEDKNFTEINSLVKPEVDVRTIYPCLYNKLDSTNIFNYSWQENGHFNGKGYQLMGNCIFEEFEKIKINEN